LCNCSEQEGNERLRETTNAGDGGE
jgi:hypothetical protein